MGSVHISSGDRDVYVCAVEHVCVLVKLSSMVKCVCSRQLCMIFKLFVLSWAGPGCDKCVLGVFLLWCLLFICGDGVCEVFWSLRLVL